MESLKLQFKKNRIVKPEAINNNCSSGSYRAAIADEMFCFSFLLKVKFLSMYLQRLCSLKS